MPNVTKLVRSAILLTLSLLAVTSFAYMLGKLQSARNDGVAVEVLSLYQKSGRYGRLITECRKLELTGTFPVTAPDKTLLEAAEEKYAEFRQFCGN